jgi:hypothetical protein
LPNGGIVLLTQLCSGQEARCFSCQLSQRARRKPILKSVPPASVERLTSGAYHQENEVITSRKFER